MKHALVRNPLYYSVWFLTLLMLSAGRWAVSDYYLTMSKEKVESGSSIPCFSDKAVLSGTTKNLQKRSVWKVKDS